MTRVLAATVLGVALLTGLQGSPDIAAVPAATLSTTTASAHSARVDDWDGPLGDAGDSASNRYEKQLAPTKKRGLQRAWKKHFYFSAFSAPVTAADGLVFDAGDYLTNHREVTKVVAFDVSTGRLVWSRTHPANTTLVVSSVGGGRVYVQVGTPHHRYLSALSEGTGRRIWNRRVSNVQYVIYSGGRAYLLGKRIESLSAKSGHVMWSRPLDYPPEQPPAVADHRVYVATQGLIEVFSSKTGHVEWRADQSDESELAVDGDYLIADVGDDDNDAGAVSAYRAHGCGHKMCKPLWTRSLPASGYHPAVADHVVVVGLIGHNDGPYYVYALNEKNGRIKWRSKSQNFPSDPAIANGIVYVPDEYGSLFAYHLLGCGHKSCRAIWSTNFHGSQNAEADVAISDHRLLNPTGGWLVAYKNK